MFRLLALACVVLSVACSGGPTAPSASPATFTVVDGSGSPLSGIQVCPGDLSCAKTDASGQATLNLDRDAQVRFLKDGVTLGGLMIVTPGSTHRVVLP